MGYENGGGAPHHVVLEERRSLTVSGVEDLHIEKLSLDGGDLKVEGEIDSISYEDDQAGGKGGFLARLLR